MELLYRIGFVFWSISWLRQIDAFTRSVKANHRPSTAGLISSTALHAGFRPSSKQQGKVAIDPKTGLYRPIRIDKSKQQPTDENGLSSWDGVKEVVYKSIDGLATLASKKTTNWNDKVTSSAKAEYTTGVVGGYSEIERELGPVMAGNAKAITKLLPMVRPGTVPKTPAEKIIAAKKEEITRDSQNEPLLPLTGLETFKSVIWGTVDAGTPGQSSQKKTPSSAFTTMSTAMESFQPAVRARMVASDEFLSALADLDSPNPVKRLAAGRKIQALARQEEKRKLLDSSPIDVAKESFYKAADTLQSAGETLKELPQRVTETYEATVNTTGKVVQAFKSVPVQVEQRAKEVQKSINETVDNTQKTIKTVQELPSRIETSVKQTEKDIQNRVQKTKDTIEGIGKAVDEITTSSKVLLGFEKPTPRPPSTPPPEPMTPSKVAWKLLSTSGSLAGDVAWFVGKESAKLAWKTTAFAAAKGGEVVSTKWKEYEKQQKVSAASTAQEDTPPISPRPPIVKPPPPSAETAAPATKNRPQSIASLDLSAREKQQTEELTQLELEIEEALRMADAAIQSAQAEINKEKGK